MDTFITIEVWDSAVGGWHRVSEEPKDLTEATYMVNEFVKGDWREMADAREYRVITTKIESIWQDGGELAATEKLRHRGCEL